MATGVFNGAKLYYEEAGSGEPLVMVHGSWTDHHSWGQVAPRLSEHFRVITYDRRGHSQSERPATQGSVHEDAADLAAVIEGLGPAPAHVVANSYGSVIALRLASQRPGLFRTLWVHEPPALGLLESDPSAASLLAESGERIRAVAEMLNAGDMEGGARQFAETIALGPGAWDEQLPPEARQTFINNAPTWLDETRDPDALTLDTTALARFSRAVMLSTGTESPPLFGPVIARLAEVLPGAQKRTFQGAGHIPHQTHPDEFVDAVTQFIGGAPS